MKASKLGPTSAPAPAPTALESSTQPQLVEPTRMSAPMVPKTLPMAMARSLPKASDTQPPRICSTSGTTCERV